MKDKFLEDKVMKKIISTFLMLTMIAATFTINVNAETLNYKDYEYRVVNDKYVELIRCKKISKENINIDGWYNIPSEINGMEVKYIGDSCFSYDLDVYNLDKVVIPDTVVYIGNNAFKRPFYDGSSSYELSWVNDIKLPNNVIFIGEGAFTQCDFEEITIPSSVKYLGSKAFEACDKLEKIYISADLNIYDSSFAYCSKLTTVELPDSLKSIGKYAFYGCSSLKSLNIPDSLKNIGDYAFYNCTALKSLSIPDGVDLGKYSIGYYSKSEVRKMVSGFSLNIKSSKKLKSYPKKSRLSVVYILNTNDSNYYDFNCEVGAEFKVKFNNDSIVSCKSKSAKTVKALNSGKIILLKSGSCDVRVTLKSGKIFTISVGDDDMKGYPRIEKKNKNGKYVNAESISVKKKKTVSLKIKGKAFSVNNVYKNTKIAKIISKKSSEMIKIKGLKKGKTTLKFKINGVKTVNLKVNVK